MSIRLLNPIPGAELTDSFGWRAAIPGVIGAQLHTGQDLAAPYGTPVRAAHAGRVNRIWWDTMLDGSPAGGNMLQIGAADCSTRYAHLSGYAVSLGDEIRAGQIIGYVGATGAAFGEHLHFELLMPGGAYVDPWPYVTSTPDPDPRKAQQHMMILDDNKSIYILDELGADHLGDFGSADMANSELIYAGTTLYGAPVKVNNRQRDLLIALARRRWDRKRSELVAAMPRDAFADHTGGKA